MKIGNKVAIYNNGVRSVLIINRINPETNTINATHLNVEREFHRKQVYLLTKKPRERVFVTRSSLKNLDSDIAYREAANISIEAFISRVKIAADDQEFVLVRKK